MSQSAEISIEGILAACRQNLPAVAQSLNNCLQAQYRLEIGEPIAWNPDSVNAGFDGPARTELALAAPCARLVGRDLDGVSVRRSVGDLGARLDLERAGSPIGFIEVGAQHGTFDLAKLQGLPLSSTATALILVGLLSKSATLPLHTWLPDAGVAPSPVTALLHAAVLVKIGVYVFARLFIANFAISPFAHQLVLIVAATSALVSAGAALIDTDMKRVIAYSTVSQIAFIFLGLAAGTHLAVTGALLYILMQKWFVRGLTEGALKM